MAAAPDSPVTPAAPGWARPFPRDEKLFVYLVLGSVVFMTVFVIGWLVLSDHNVPTATKRTTPAAFMEQVNEMKTRYGGGDGRVYLPAGTEGYIVGLRYIWHPDLVLEAGQTYRIWVSATDALHGFSIVGHGQNVNLQIVPNHAYGATFTPDRPGRYLIVCNEYCGIGHAQMKGSITVVTSAEMARLQAASAAGATTKEES